MTKLAIVSNDEGRLKLRTQRQSKRESLVVSSEVKQHLRGHNGRLGMILSKDYQGIFPSKFEISYRVHQNIQHIGPSFKIGGGGLQCILGVFLLSLQQLFRQLIKKYL